MPDKIIQLTPSPPEKSAKLTIYAFGGAGIQSVGPRGGWSYMSIDKVAIPEITHAFVEHLTGRHVCRGCFRPEEDCSANPCEGVIEERADAEI